MINNLLAGLLGKDTFAYLDGVIIVSKDLHTHFSKLQQVLEKLQDAGLKVKLAECEFLKSKSQFLGHVVDGTGIHTVDAKVAAVKNFPKPQTADNVRSFLGFTGYYRSFIKDFASVASPLTRLLKKDVAFHWTDVHEKSFTALK